MAPRLGKDGVTVRQQKLVRELAKGSTVKDAAIKAGYPGEPETARVMASQDLRKPSVAAAIDRALDVAGLTVQATAQIVADAAKAEKVTLNKFGAVKSLGPDHSIRLDAAKTAGRWRGFDSNADLGGQILGVGVFILKGLSSRGLPPIEGELSE